MNMKAARPASRCSLDAARLRRDAKIALVEW
jgi:hypothetical protein